MCFNRGDQESLTPWPFTFWSSQTWARKAVDLCSGRSQGDSLVNQGREGHEYRLRLDLDWAGVRLRGSVPEGCLEDFRHDQLGRCLRTWARRADLLLASVPVLLRTGPC